MVGYIGSKAVTLSTTAADVTGDATINGNLTVNGTTVTVDSAAAQEIRLGDNDKMTFGDATGGDLQIYHDGTHSYVDENGTGQLKIRSNGTGVLLQTVSGENLATFANNAAVNLYYDNAAKLATTSTGIDVTGTVTADGLTVDNGDILLDSSTQAFLKLDRGSAASHYALTRYYTGGTEEWRTGTYNDASSNFYVGTPSGKYLSLTSGGDISFYEDTGTTAKFFWDASAESLGIGTSSIDSNAKLAVSNNGAEGLEIRANSTNIELFAYNRSAATYEPIVYNGLSHEWRNSNGNVATIDSSGRVGIGTTTPTEALTVSGGNIQVDSFSRKIGFKVSGNSNAGYLIPYDGSGNTQLVNERSSGNLIFKAANTERMRIGSNGTVLLGKTADNLTDAGQVFSTAGSSFTRSGGAACQFNRNTNDGEVIRLSKDGTTVGAITTYNNTVQYGGALGSALYLDTSAYLPANAGGRTNSTIDIGSGTFKYKDAYFSGTVNAANFNTTSDATLKTNVETLTGSLDAVKAMRGVSYDWIENGNSEVGVIAQEVEEVIPDVVSTDDQGIKSVKYGNLVGVLIEAIKEQQAQIDELKAQLNS